MDKRLSLQLNGSRRVTGILRGYDPFMNVVLDDTIEEVSATEKHNIGMVVSMA
jgi:small nuclear ribonucleoprotein G